MKFKIKKVLKTGFLFLSFPAVGLAANTNVSELAASLKTILLNVVIPFVLVLATVFFVTGIIKYIMNSGSADKQKEARNMILWSVIILVAALSIWGLVNVIISSLDLGDKTIPAPPFST